MDKYTKKLIKLASEQPRELITVILNEQEEIGGKKQFCARLPVHTDVSQYQNKKDLEKESSRRTSNKEFKRIEQIALLGHIPKFSNRGKHNILINPDIRSELIRDSKGRTSLFSVAGLEDAEETEEPDISLGRELEVFDWMNRINRIGNEATDAMIWYARRAINRGNIPYQGNNSESSNLGLRTYLFGQIAIFLEDWDTSEPEIAFSEFAKKSGEKEDGYCIKGRFSADPLKLKSRKELCIEEDVAVKSALKDWIRATLVTFFKYSTFQPAEINDQDVRTNQVFPGDGKFEYEDLTPVLTEEYDDIERDLEEDEWKTYWLTERLTPDVDVQPDKIKFELDLLPLD